MLDSFGASALSAFQRTALDARSSDSWVLWACGTMGWTAYSSGGGVISSSTTPGHRAAIDPTNNRIAFVTRAGYQAPALNDVVVLDSDLNLLWQRDVGGHANDVAFDASGSVVVACCNAPQGWDSQGYIKKYNSTGALQWTATLANQLSLNAIDCDGANNIYTTSSYDRVNGESVYKYGTAGNSLAAWGLGIHTGAEVYVDRAAGHIYVGGSEWVGGNNLRRFSASLSVSYDTGIGSAGYHAPRIEKRGDHVWAMAGVGTSNLSIVRLSTVLSEQAADDASDVFLGVKGDTNHAYVSLAGSVVDKVDANITSVGTFSRDRSFYSAVYRY